MEREKGSHSQKNTKSPHKLEATVDIDESLLTYGRNNDLERRGMTVPGRPPTHGIKLAEG